MATLGRYDAELQMFIEETKDADESYLLFMRYLHENGRMGVVKLEEIPNLEELHGEQS